MGQLIRTFRGAVAEQIAGEFTPLTAKEYVKNNTEWVESFLTIVDKDGNKTPLDAWDKNGQIGFAAAVFYDNTLPVGQKIELLEKADSAAANYYLGVLCCEQRVELFGRVFALLRK